ncbi:MAG: hypothetical protein PHT48_09710 [Dechloromonas sp.]|nr:hypothetical protein [Dechloromonas sp.]
MSNVVDIKTVYDLTKVITQRDFASLVGVTEQAVSDMARRGVIMQGQPLREWLKRYCGHLREQAAGRSGSGDLNLVDESARVKKEQADRIAMQNAISRREFGPIEALEQGLSDCMARVASQLDTIPAKLKVASDHLGADELDLVTGVIAQVRNDIAGMRIDWFGDINEGTDEDLEE